jgi:putative ABC transport system permease protein
MRFLLDLAWRDLRASGRSLWIFCACLALGVTLVSASGGLHRLISLGLLADTRNLMGGDLEVDTNQALPEPVLQWMNSNGEVSLVTEMYTMLGTEDGNFLRVELQSMDARYPLYGKLRLEPEQALSSATEFRAGHWGAAIDPALANRLGIGVGDKIYVGSLALAVRALVLEQPDRNLNADWRGPPVLLAGEAMRASGLIQPGSRLDFEYRVATDIVADLWRERFYTRFPDQPYEVRTFEDRSQKISERLGQIASGLLIIGFSTLFIGGLGVFNSIQSYLQGKLKTIATLRTLGLRNRRLATVYLLQVGILSVGASLAGCVIGAAMALLGATVAATQIPVEASLQGLLLPGLIALSFGMLTAFTFALPALGRALSVSPATLFRDGDQDASDTPSSWWLAAFCGAALIVVLVLLALPDPLFGFGFIALMGLILILLDLVVRGIRRATRALDGHRLMNGNFALRLAMANLHRPGTPLRTALISLGSALTLLVACTLVVASLLRAINATIPEQAPALVLYDINSNQLQPVVETITTLAGNARVLTAPLVRARIGTVNGKPLSAHLASDQEQFRDSANDQYKLSYRAGNIDDIRLIEGSWSFSMEGRSIAAEIVAIYSQKGLQTRFWFEGIMTDGVLDPFIHRHVGAAFMDDTETAAAQRRIAALAPNVISVPTASLLATARNLLGQATAGLVVVAGVSLGASLLVLISVMAAGRTRQIYDATILNALGTRLSLIKRSLHLEYLLLALITSLFAILLGSAIALPLLQLRLKLPSADLIWLGAITAIVVSMLSLSLGARYLLRRLSLKPAVLLRNAN